MRKALLIFGITLSFISALAMADGKTDKAKDKDGGRKPSQTTCDESGQTVPAGISKGNCQICKAYSGGAYYMYMAGNATHDEDQFVGRNAQQSTIFTLDNVKKSFYYHVGAGDCGVTCQ